MRVQRTPAVVALVWLVGVAGGWWLSPNVVADDSSKSETPKVPAYRAVKTADEAVSRITQLGGRVRRLSAKRKMHLYPPFIGRYRCALKGTAKTLPVGHFCRSPAPRSQQKYTEMLPCLMKT